MMDSAAPPRFEAMTTGVLLDRTFRLYTANFSLMLGIAAMAYVPFYLIVMILESHIETALNTQRSLLSVLLSYLVMLLLWSSIVVPVANGASTFAISERYLGNNVTIGAALYRGLRHLIALSVAQITASIRIFFGFIFFVVPGILLALSYSLVVPTVLVEGQKGIASLRRSRDLIKGFRVKALCVLLVLYAFQFVVTRGVYLVIGALFQTDRSIGAVLASALSTLLSVVLTPLIIIAPILLYYDMRIRKEGFDLEMLSRAIMTEPQALSPQPTPSS